MTSKLGPVLDSCHPKNKNKNKYLVTNANLFFHRLVLRRVHFLHTVILLGSVDVKWSGGLLVLESDSVSIGALLQLKIEGNKTRLDSRSK